MKVELKNYARLASRLKTMKERPDYPETRDEIISLRDLIGTVIGGLTALDSTLADKLAALPPKEDEEKEEEEKLEEEPEKKEDEEKNLHGLTVFLGPSLNAGFAYYDVTRAYGCENGLYIEREDMEPVTLFLGNGFQGCALLEPKEEAKAHARLMGWPVRD